jgi:uncharacterized membrane protein YcaP (DUF421 family)
MDLVLRALILFPLALFLTRVVTRRELSSLEPFDLVLLVVLGDMLQQGITQNDQSVTGAAIVVVTLALLSVGSAYLTYRFRPLRRVMEGEPVILIANGDLVHGNLRRERITLEELAAQARLVQVPDLGSVRWAVMETNGRISFLTRQGGDG